MKSKVIILIALLIVIAATTACEKATKADTPLNAGSLTKIEIERQDYDGFINSVMKEIRDPISEEYFNEIKTIVTPGAEHRTYQLLRFENDEMLLIQLSPEIQIKFCYVFKDFESAILNGSRIVYFGKIIYRNIVL